MAENFRPEAVLRGCFLISYFDLLNQNEKPCNSDRWCLLEVTFINLTPSSRHYLERI